MQLNRSLAIIALASPLVLALTDSTTERLTRRDTLVGKDRQHESVTQRSRMHNGIGFTLDRGVRWSTELGWGTNAEGWGVAAGADGVGAWEVTVPVLGIRIGGMAGVDGIIV